MYFSKTLQTKALLPLKNAWSPLVHSFWIPGEESDKDRI